jgi:Ca-activated chloride channel family protein
MAMIPTRFIGYILPLAMAGCGGPSSPDQQTSRNAQNSVESAHFSPAERRLLDGGAKPVEVLAARAFIVPFTRTDQSSCFGTPDLKGAKLAGKQGITGPRPTRVAIMVDGSGSMAGRIGPRTKVALAHEATLSFIDGLPAGVPASLAVFGQQGNNSEDGKAKSCSGIDVLAPMSSDRAKLKAAVGGVRAVGWTPLAAGLRAAQKQFATSSVPGEQVIYVVSDGIETCGGDPVAVAREINKGDTRAVVNIIGFGLPAGEAAALQSVAGAGGGRFVNISDDDSYHRAVAAFREDMRLSENRFSASKAKTENAFATGVEVTDSVLCTGDMIYRQTSGALADYDARQAQGETLPPRYQIVALMREWQDGLSARRDANAKRLRAAQDAANAKVETARKAAQ